MKKIYVYRDKGVGPLSFKALLESLKESSVCSNFVIEKIDSETLLKGEWQQDCCLLIVPGGQDIPYHTALQGEGTQIIRNYVLGGGHYLGICAGAYFASEDVVFEEGKEHHVVEKRELCFFPGRAVGTIYSEKKFNYIGHDSVHAALIKLEEAKLFTYYNGGCYFEKAEHYMPDVEILAHYQNADLQDVAAIILCRYGRGKALLSGVHFEVSAKFSQHDEKLFQQFRADEEKRKKLFEHLLASLLH